MVSPEGRATFQIRRLEPDDDRTAFRSGNVDLDRFFIRYAGQNQFRHHIGTTYVAADDAGFIGGFATVSAAEIAPGAIPAAQRRRLPKYPVPVLRLARLAVDERLTGIGIGHLLIRSVFLLARQMADDFGCAGVLVDAKPEAVPFYERLGFVRLDAVAGLLGDRPEPLPMFIALRRIPPVR